MLTRFIIFILFCHLLLLAHDFYNFYNRKKNGKFHSDLLYLIKDEIIILLILSVVSFVIFGDLYLFEIAINTINNIEIEKPFVKPFKYE